MKYFVIYIIIGIFITKGHTQSFDNGRLEVPEISIKNTDSIIKVKRYKGTKGLAFPDTWDLPKNPRYNDKDFIFEEGKLKKILNYNFENLVENVYNFRYNENGLESVILNIYNKVIHKWGYNNGNVIYELECLTPDVKFREWFFAYKKDKLISCTKKNRNDIVIEQITYEYDSLDKLIAYKEIKRDKVKVNENYRSIGQQEEVLINYVNLFNQIRSVRYLLNKDTINNIESGEIINSKNKTIATFKMKLDNRNNVIDAKVLDDKGNLALHRIFEYDSLNHKICEERFSYKTKDYTKFWNYTIDGQLKEHLFYVYGLIGNKKLMRKEVNFYNYKGNIIRKELFDREKQLFFCYNYQYILKM